MSCQSLYYFVFLLEVRVTPPEVGQLKIPFLNRDKIKAVPSQPGLAELVSPYSNKIDNIDNEPNSRKP